MGSRSPIGRGNFYGLCGPFKRSRRGRLRCKMDHSVRRTSSRLAGVTFNFLRREKSADAAFCQKYSSTTCFIKLDIGFAITCSTLDCSAFMCSPSAGVYTCKFGTDQRSMTLCSWEGNRGPGGVQAAAARCVCAWLKSPTGCLLQRLEMQARGEWSWQWWHCDTTDGWMVEWVTCFVVIGPRFKSWLGTQKATCRLNET